MGRDGKEAACYLMRDLTRPRTIRLDPTHLLYPEPETNIFVTPQLPPEWSVREKEFSGIFQVVCVWGDCVNQTYQISKRDGSIVPMHGHMLTRASHETPEEAYTILMEHLSRVHKIKQKIEFTEELRLDPYGFFVISPPPPVY